MHRVFKKMWLGSIAAGLTWASGGGAEPWEIKEFDVVNFRLLNVDQLTKLTFDGGPGTRQFYKDYIDTVLGGLPFDLERFGEIMAPIFDKSIMDDHLKLTAEFFEQWDLPEPTLNPIVSTQDVDQAYRLYLVQNLPNALGLYHIRDCIDEDKIGVILIDANDVFSGQGVTDRGLITLSHELFHAVEFSTPLYTQLCKKVPTLWISEGIADAVGLDITRSALAADVPQVEKPQAIAGARNYTAPLHLPATNTDAYMTSSFWRFMAEYYAYRFAGAPQPGPAPGPVHYGYLDSFYERPASVLADREIERPPGELEMLDDWVKSTYPGKGLRDLYTLFASALPFYPDRRQEQWGAPIDSTTWLKWTFGGCPTVELTPEAPVSEPVLFSIEEIAAACWMIDVSAFNSGERTDQIPVVGDVFGDAVELEQLAAGSGLNTDWDSFATSGNFNTELGPPPPVRVSTKVSVDPSSSDEGDYVTFWEFPFEPGINGSFVVTNVARNAVETQPIGTLSIVFTALAEYASMGPTTVDAGAVAEAINTPLEIELDEYRALVQPGLYSKVGDQYIGVRHSEGIENPCTLLISGYTDRQPGVQFNNMLGITLQMSGPIRPGEYAMAPYSESRGDPSEILPPRQAVAGVLLTNMPEGTNDLQFESGFLEIRSISPHLVVGYISGVANNRELSSQTGNYEIVETRTLGAKFSIKVEGILGKYRDGDFPCIKSN